MKLKPFKFKGYQFFVGPGYWYDIASEGDFGDYVFFAGDVYLNPEGTEKCDYEKMPEQFQQDLYDKAHKESMKISDDRPFY